MPIKEITKIKERGEIPQTKSKLKEMNLKSIFQMNALNTLRRKRKVDREEGRE